MKQYAQGRVNDIYKGVNDIELIRFREPDDERLPECPMSYKEFKKAREIAVGCQEKIAERDLQYKKMKAEGKMPKRAAPMRMYNVKHPCHKIYAYLCEVAKSHPEAKGKCILCGDENPQATTSNSPICDYCARHLRKGIVRGTNNTQGLKAYGKICVVCEINPAAYNLAGMCKTCYKWAQKIQVFDTNELHRRFLEDGCKRHQSNNIQRSVSANCSQMFIAKTWHIK